jgi:hypothetical protein
MDETQPAQADGQTDRQSAGADVQPDHETAQADGGADTQEEDAQGADDPGELVDENGERLYSQKYIADLSKVHYERLRRFIRIPGLVEAVGGRASVPGMKGPRFNEAAVNRIQHLMAANAAGLVTPANAMAWLRNPQSAHSVQTAVLHDSEQRLASNLHTGLAARQAGTSVEDYLRRMTEAAERTADAAEEQRDTAKRTEALMAELLAEARRQPAAEAPMALPAPTTSATPTAEPVRPSLFARLFRRGD